MRVNLSNNCSIQCHLIEMECDFYFFSVETQGYDRRFYDSWFLVATQEQVQCRTESAGFCRSTVDCKTGVLPFYNVKFTGISLHLTM